MKEGRIGEGPKKSEAEKANDLERLKKWVKKVLPDNFDKIDVESEVDSSLSYDENKSHLRELLKALIKDLKSQAEYSKAEQERIDTEKIRDAVKEVEAYNNNIKFEDNKDLEEYYAPIARGVNKLCQGYSNLLFIRGKGGIGKSWQARKALVKNNADFVEIAGDITEAYLYRLLFENNGKIIWFKDTVKLLSCPGAINLLKAATETEDQKILTKNNYSKDQSDLPDKFLCRCKFLFDYNNVFGTNSDDFEALTSRGDYMELPLSNNDVKAILSKIAKEDWQKEVTNKVIECFQSNGMVKLNLRTQWKAFKTYKYAKHNNLEWEKEVEAEMSNMTRTRAMLYTLLGNDAMKTTEVKKIMLKEGICNSLTSANRRIQEWLYLEELYKFGEGDRDFYVCINPKETK